MAYVGAIDQGTSSTRFMILDRDGGVRGSAQVEHTQHYPQPGWVEHDAEEIWRNTQQVIEQALQQANLTTADLATVGLTNQRETTVIWDRETGKPYHRAVVWNDGRTAGLAADFAHKLGGQYALQAVTGLPIASYFCALKIVWLFENVPGLREAAESGRALFGTIDTWLMWQLTGRQHHLTDVTNASRTLLFNLNTLQWDDALLARFGVPRKMLPRIVSSSEVYATAAAGTPLSGVRLSGILGDQHAALFGQGGFKPGQVKSTYGTGCFIFLNAGESWEPSKHGLLNTVAYKLGDQPPVYALEGAVQVSGSLIQWLRDQLQLIESAPETEALAQQVDDNGGVYFVPAFAGLFAPYWREDARGAVVGLTAFNNKSHVVRAALEASAFQAQEVFEAMQEDSGRAITDVRVDGGMTVNEVVMQFQADLSRARVCRPKILETTAVGAAFSAGLAVGFWDSLDELATKNGEDKTWQPAMAQQQRDQTFGRWKRAVQRTLNWTSDSDPPPAAAAAAAEQEPSKKAACPVHCALSGLLLLGVGVAVGLALGQRLSRRL